MNRSVKIVLIVLVASMLVAPTLLQAHASVVSLYDLTGTWTLRYTYPVESGSVTENHTMVINFFNGSSGDFSGFGFNNFDPSYNWTMMGNEYLSDYGMAVQFTITYDPNSPVPYPSYIYAAGIISSSTFMNGTATLLTYPIGEIGGVLDGGMPASWEASKLSPDPNVTLNFPPGTDVKSVSVMEYTPATSPYPPLPNAIGPIYNITVVTASSRASLTSTSSASSSLTSGLTGLVTVGLHYDPSSVSDPSKLVIAQFDFLVGDVNHDGKVNLLDLFIIAKALFSTRTSRNWNPTCDLNGDGRVDLKDMWLALQNLGKTAKWINHPTTVDTLNDFVYCTTDHFSGIGIHL
jgi:hypothetical protein